jgi:hypothetical protein
MSRVAGDAVGGMKAVSLITGPYYGFAHQSSVRKTVQGLERSRDHAFNASDIATHQMNGTILTIMGGDEANVFLFPNPVGTSDDIVNYININVIKAVEWLPASPLWCQQLSNISTIEA